jgi:uncharacterized damage-inducible protein DinB
MSCVTSLLDLKRRAYAASPWHSLKAALKDIGDETFFAVPPRHHGFSWMNGSIADIVYHVTGDKLVQISAAFDDGATTWESVREQLTKSDRQHMLDDLESAEAKLVQAIEAQTDESLRSKVGAWGGKRMSCDDLFLMLIEHDFYHAGQIRYIRNVLES